MKKLKAKEITKIKPKSMKSNEVIFLYNILTRM